MNDAQNPPGFPVGISTPIGYPTQIGILVEDIDRAERRYGELFGIRSWRRYLYDGESVPVRRYRGQEGAWAMKLSMSGDSPQVELIEVVAGPSIYQEFLDEKGPGMHHLGVFVDSLEQATEAMKDRGFEVIQEGSGHGLDGDGAFAYYDTTNELGVFIEAIEVPKRRMPTLDDALAPETASAKE
jgi:catechol 2,3-dioxygenase-like lactoylglutathione lyase family enzyme